MFESPTHTSLRRQAIDLVKTRGYEYRAEPFKLASGQLSHDYIDAKYAVDDGARLAVVCRAIVELADEAGIEYTAVGGLTMGADALAHGIALITECQWFSVRKEPKSRGREAWIEGARIGSGDRVLLVDDVITTGGSTIKAFDKVIEAGAAATGVIPMVDRGDTGAVQFEQRNVVYAPLITYRDLGIERVGPSPATSPDS